MKNLLTAAALILLSQSASAASLRLMKCSGDRCTSEGRPNIEKMFIGFENSTSLIALSTDKERCVLVTQTITDATALFTLLKSTPDAVVECFTSERPESAESLKVYFSTKYRILSN